MRDDTTALAALPDAVLEVDRDGTIAFANPRAERLFGYEAGAMVGLSIEALVPELSRVKHARLRSEYLSAGQGMRPMGSGREFPALRGDGTEIMAEVAIGPTPGGGALAVVRDHTATAKAREDLEKKEEHFRIAASHTADFLQYINVQENRYVWYGEIDRCMGYEPGEFPRAIDDWLELLHPDDRDRIWAEMQRIMDEEDTGWNFRYRVRHRDGSYRHWLDRGSVTGWLDDGRPNEGRGGIVDETDQVRARQQLEEAVKEARAQGRMNQHILGSISSHLAVLDRDGTVLTVNDAWADFARDNGAESVAVGVGVNYLGVCERAAAADPAAEPARRGIKAVLDGARETFTLEYPCHSPDRKRWYSMVVTGEKDGDGVVIHHSDVTELVQTQEGLRAALAEVSKLKDRLQAESDYLREEVESTHGFDEFVGKSQRIAATLRRAGQVARTDATVLLLGETGSGKEILARGIHARGTRASRPLIKIDCSTLPSGLIESELFGHEKGAFTGATGAKEGRFELADGGTVFLDEIGELPLDLQAKLLRVLEEGVFLPLGSKRERRVDVRVIAATNRDLEAEAREGRFRPDLYYRLSVFPIAIPPLRERREDIPLLVSHLVSRLGAGLGRRVSSVARPSMDALVAYDWPGNVRELQNVIERSLILCPGDVLTVEEALGGVEASPRPRSDSLKEDLESVERTNIVQALEASGWKIKGPGNAASRLGLKPSTLRSRMTRLGIQRPAP